MADRSWVQSELTTLYDLSQAHLDGCAYRKPATFKLHRHYLKEFIGSLGDRSSCSARRD